MGDRELPQANRTVARRLLAQRQAAHEAAKAAARSTIPTEPPPSFDFLSQRSKRNQLFMERAAAIERDNLILLEKMRRVLAERQMPALASEPFAKDSLNRGARQAQMLAIMSENEALLRRIQMRRPVYEVAAFEKAHAAKESRLARIGRFPYVSDSVPDATPPPIPNNKIVYYGHAGKHLPPGSTSRRMASTATGTLPKIGATLAGSQSHTARKPATAAASSSTAYASTARSVSSSSPTRPSPPSAAGNGTALSARKNKVFGARALVYTGQDIVIDGVTVQLSVYERAAGAGTGAGQTGAAGLEFVAVDPPANSSTGTPVIYSFKALADAFAVSSAQAQDVHEESKSADSSRPVPLELFNDPARTRELIMDHLLARLTWRPAGTSGSTATRQLCMRGVDEEKSSGGARKKDKGPTLYARVHFEVRHLPADQVVADPVGVLYALQEDTRQYAQIAHCTLERRGAAGSSSAVHVGSVVIPYFARVDGPLRLGVFEVDGSSGAVVASSCLGETKFHLQAMLSSREMVIKLVKSGSKLAGTNLALRSKGAEDATAVRITHEQLGSKPPAEEPQEEEYADDEGFEQEEEPKKPAAAAEQAKADEEAKEEAVPVAASSKASSKRASATTTQAMAASAVAAADAAIAASNSDDEYADDTMEAAATEAPAAASSDNKAAENKAAEAAAGDAQDEDDDASEAKAVPKLFQRGCVISGLEFLVRAVDSAAMDASARQGVSEPDALLFHLYFRPTSAVFDHAVSKAELGPLLASVEHAEHGADATLAQQAQALLSLFSATESGGDDGKSLSVQFNHKPLVAWKDLAVFKPSGSKSNRASTKSSAASSPVSSPKSSPRASTKKTASLERLNSSSKKGSMSAKDAPAGKRDSTKKAATEAAGGSPNASAAPSTAPSVQPSPSPSTKDLALGSRKGSQAELSRKGSMKKSGAAGSNPASPRASKSKRLTNKTSSAAAAPAAGEASQPSSPKASKTKKLTARMSSEGLAPAAAEEKDASPAAEEVQADKPAAAEASADADDEKPAATAEDEFELPADVDEAEPTKPAVKGPSRPASAAKSASKKPVSRPASSKKKEPEAAAAAAPAAADDLDDYGADFDDDIGAGLDDPDAEGEKKEEEAKPEPAAAAEEAEEKPKAAEGAEEPAAAADAEADAEADAKKKAAEEEAEKAAAAKEQEAAVQAAKEAEAEAEKKKAAEAAAAAAAEAKAAEKAAKAQAEAKAKEEAEAKQKAEKEAAEAKAKEQAEAAAAAEAAKKTEAEAAEKAKADAAAAAAASAASAAPSLPSGPMTLSMSVRCVGLPPHPKHATLSPMVALYAEAPSGEYAFHSQTEASTGAGASPTFVTAVTFATDSSTNQAAIMLSVYHVVEGAALSEEDMVGQALSKQQDVLDAMQSDSKELVLPIQSGDAIVPDAQLILSNITVTPGHAAAASTDSDAAAATAADDGPKDSFDVFVTAKGLRREGKDGEPVCPMVALYVQDGSGEYAYIAQTERIEDSSSPLFETAIRVEASRLVDRAIMFSAYHVASAEGAEISADDAIGAGTATMHALTAATEANPLRMQIINGETLLDGAEITAFVKKVS